MNPDSPEAHVSNIERQMLEAMLDAGGPTWTRLASQLSGDRVLRIMSIATSAMVFRKWPNDPSLADIAGCVAELVGKYAGELPVAPVVVESVIRGTLDEPELLDEISAKDIGLAELFIVASMRDKVLRSPEDRSAYISEVLKAVG